MNKNQIGPNNEMERYGLYLLDGENEKLIARSDDEVELVQDMHDLAKNHTYFAHASRISTEKDTRIYEVRDDSWSENFVIETCPYYENAYG